MSFSLLRPLYPQIAGSLTAQVTTVTAGSTTVTGFNLNPPASAQLVELSVQTSDVNCFSEGSTPTGGGGGGVLLKAGVNPVIWAASRYNNTKFIRVTSATVDAQIVATPLNGG